MNIFEALQTSAWPSKCDRLASLRYESWIVMIPLDQPWKLVVSSRGRRPVRAALAATDMSSNPKDMP